MTHILHIFRKDTRRFWLEIVASLMTMAALVYVYPLRWRALPIIAAEGDRSTNIAVIGTLLAGLVIASWVLLISRSIHAESLVGDRQFWLTRPYGWKSLLAAKLMFLAVYLYLPLLVAQWLLLGAAGLNSPSLIPGLLFNLLLITGFLVLPLIAIATVTENFLHVVLTVMGVAVAGVSALAAITLHGYGNHFNSLGDRLGRFTADNLDAPVHSLTSIGHHQQLLFALLFATVSGAVVLVQYARRRTWVCRAILLALPIAIAIGGVVKAHYALSGQALLDRDYPKVADGTEPLQLSPFLDQKSQLIVFRGNDDAGVPVAAIQLPVHVSEIAEGTALLIDHRLQRMTLEAADGFTWSSEKSVLEIAEHRLPGDRIHDDDAGPREYFQMPYALYERIKNGPVTLRFTLPVTELQEIGSVHVAMPTHEVAVPGFGVCTVKSVGFGTLECRSALREPQLTYVDVQWSDAPCNAPQTAIQLFRGNQWPGLLDREPAEFGIVPIQFAQVSYSWPYVKGRDMWKQSLCTGAPMTFTQYKLKGRTQIDLTIHDLYFPPENPASNIDHSDGTLRLKTLN